MRILVTGGAGFIGNHLCRALLSHGHEVICLDNFSSGFEDNVADLKDNERFSIVYHDVVKPYFSDQPIDQIYHLACPASPKAYQSNPIKTVKTNVFGTIHMLGLARRHGARILLTSTSEVYGDAIVHPQSEEYWGNVNPIGIRSCYDEGKRIAETLCMEYHRNHGVDIRIARIFNTYGPRMHPDDGRVVSNVIRQCLRNEPITLYGDGTQTRSFCYVDDMVRGLIALMTQTETIGPINLGNPHEITILELVRQIVECIPETISVYTLCPLPADDPVQRKPDIAKARRYLAWEPQIDLAQGLRQTIGCRE